MSAILPSDVQRFFSSDSSELERLKTLWDSLTRNGKGLLVQQGGPYPADHGIQHIEHILSNIAKLLDCCQRASGFPHLDEKYHAVLFAAGMIHDVGMVHLVDKGAYSDEAKQSRERHARYEVIEALVGSLLHYSRFDSAASSKIMLVASAHARDDEKSAQDKLTDACESALAGERERISVLIWLLRVADFLDIGGARLRENFESIDWQGQQRWHLHKHRILFSPAIGDGAIVLNFSPPEMSRLHTSLQAWTESLDATRKGTEDVYRKDMESVATLQRARDELRAMLASLRETTKTEWHLAPLDHEAELFGEVCPLSKGMDLFGPELEGAYKTYLADQAKHGAAASTKLFTIDMMGHSLYCPIKSCGHSIASFPASTDIRRVAPLQYESRAFTCSTT